MTYRLFIEQMLYLLSVVCLITAWEISILVSILSYSFLSLYTNCYSLATDVDEFF
jgi:hypothetical protein